MIVVASNSRNEI